MNKEWKDKWVTALRSGEYEQTTGRLRDGDGYCCLGVLCDLAKYEAGIDWTVNTIGRDEGAIKQYLMDTTHGILPFSIQDIVGLDSSDPEIDLDGRGEVSLSKLNDEGRSFREIADIIEKHL